MENISDVQMRSEGNWHPGGGGKLKICPPPLKKILKGDIEMSSIQLITCIIISA